MSENQLMKRSQPDLKATQRGTNKDGILTRKQDRQSSAKVPTSLQAHLLREDLGPHPRRKRRWTTALKEG